MSSGRVLVSAAMGAVVLKAGHVQPVWAGHPWVFAQAVERIELCAALRDRHAQAARAYFTSRAVTASHES